MRKLNENDRDSLASERCAPLASRLERSARHTRIAARHYRRARVTARFSFIASLGALSSRSAPRWELQYATFSPGFASLVSGSQRFARYAEQQIKNLSSRLTPRERERADTIVLANRENPDLAIALALSVEDELAQVILKQAGK